MRKVNDIANIQSNTRQGVNAGVKISCSLATLSIHCFSSLALVSTPLPLLLLLFLSIIFLIHFPRFYLFFILPPAIIDLYFNLKIAGKNDVQVDMQIHLQYIHHGSFAVMLANKTP